MTCYFDSAWSFGRQLLMSLLLGESDHVKSSAILACSINHSHLQVLDCFELCGYQASWKPDVTSLEAYAQSYHSKLSESPVSPHPHGDFHLKSWVWDWSLFSASQVALGWETPDSSDWGSFREESNLDWIVYSLMEISLMTAEALPLCYSHLVTSLGEAAIQLPLFVVHHPSRRKTCCIAIICISLWGQL